MASSINASTSGGGGIITTADATGNLDIQSGGSTVVAVTSTGASVTGTLAVSGGVTLTTTLPVLQGGTGVTTSTGTGAGVHSVGPSISSAVMSTMASSVITGGTAVATTSGTSVSFTSIPSWVKRITMMTNVISTNGVSGIVFRIGTGGTLTTSGYTSIMGIQYPASNLASAASSVGFPVWHDNSSYTNSGQIVLTNLSGNIWQACGLFIQPIGSTLLVATCGFITLGGTLNIAGIATTNGTDTFDAGSINILYE